jgi:hypothetical protein
MSGRVVYSVPGRLRVVGVTEPAEDDHARVGGVVFDPWVIDEMAALTPSNVASADAA